MRDVDRATALAVATAYDHLQDRGREGRVSSSILHLKNFNNWVKSVLIASYVPRPCARVLDLACGKLGDLNKWRKAGVRRYCGVDISRTGVEDATERFNAICGAGSGILAKLARADLGATDLPAAGVLGPGEQFDAISIQFALHYMFQTEARALTFFANIRDRLAPGGIFLGTIPDAALLVRRLRDLPPGETAFGNSIYRVAFTPEAASAQSRIGSAPYGLRYTFFLAESVEHVDEYLVPWQLLRRLAASVGLVPLAADNFHAFFSRMCRDPVHAALLSKMSVLDCEGTLSAEEWEAAGLYRVFAFRRPLPGEPYPPLPPLPRGLAGAAAATAAPADAAPAAATPVAAPREFVFDPAAPAPVPPDEAAALAAALPPLSALVPSQAARVPGGGTLPYKPVLSVADIADLLA